MSTELVTISAVELEELRRCEITIEEGLQVFVAVGNALAEIREKRLYRAKYSSFAEYCTDRWKISKTHANRLIAGAAAVKCLGPVKIKPVSEAQVRPLAGLKPDEQREAWVQAEAMAKRAGVEVPSAPIVERAVELVTGKAAPIERERKYLILDEFIEKFRTWATSQGHLNVSAIQRIIKWMQAQ